MTTDELIGYDELAGLLKKSKDWLYRNRAQLQRNEGFPRPSLPHLWSRRAVQDWMYERSGRGAGPVTTTAKTALDEAAFAELLDRNAAALAAGDKHG